MIKEILISWPTQCQLIFFSLSMLAGCNQPTKDESSALTIRWKDGRAIAMVISRDILKALADKDIPNQVELHLVGKVSSPAIAGDFSNEPGAYIFTPLIPFTRGLRYDLIVKQTRLASIDIPRDSTVPKLIAIYPSADTVPENLLKIYLVFSRPMLEGHASSYIKLIDRKGDSLPNIFLNLQGELWNAERTILTLWLDPGRIKRDLQPNQLLGPPLKQGGQYHLLVAHEWPDQDGNPLAQSYNKYFVTKARDTISPAIDHWKLNPPLSGSMQPFSVYLNEPLDFILLQNAISLKDSCGNRVKCKLQVENKESTLEFSPSLPWTAGLYRLEIESRLEDLAGNNLNRLFDLDLKSPGTATLSNNRFELDWRVN
jgi:hypothetical protein